MFTLKGTDPSICENIDDSQRGTQTSGKDLCYVGAIKFNPDIDFCENKIKAEPQKNTCFAIVAKVMKDKTICERIQGKYTDHRRKSCIDYIERTSIN